MACRLVSAKPLSEPMLEYCKLDPKEQSEILIEFQTLSFKKSCLKVSSAKWRPFCLGLNVLTAKCYYMGRDKYKPIHQGTVMTWGIRPTTCLYESVELSCFHNKSKYHNVSISHFITTCVPKSKYIRWVSFCINSLVYRWIQTIIISSYIH